MRVSFLSSNESCLGAKVVRPDKTGERFFHVAGWWWPVILGFVISLSTPSVGGRYVSMFLMAIGYAGECHR
jgi:hypothetical protein